MAPEVAVRVCAMGAGQLRLTLPQADHQAGNGQVVRVITLKYPVSEVFHLLFIFFSCCITGFGRPSRIGQPDYWYANNPARLKED
jgi:hypothetical protein